MNLVSQKYLKLAEASRILSSTLNLSDLLRQIMKLATEVVEAESSSLLFYDEAREELVFDLALTEKESELKGITIKLGEGIAGWCALNKKSRIANDVETDPQWAKRADSRTQFKTRSVIAVPILYQGKLLGVVESVNKKSGKFTAEDLTLLEAFAGQSAVSIENAKLFSRLQEEKEKLEAVFSQMSDGAIFTDLAGKKLMANSAAEKLIGKEYLKHPMIREIFAGFSQNPPLDDIISRRDRPAQFEFRRRQGKTLYIAGVAGRILDDKRKMLGQAFIFRDVTEEKKEYLLKRNFLSLMSHKLKTPLVTITGYGPLLLGTKLNDMQRKSVKSICSQGVHLANLVDKLLNFTTIESGELTLSKNTGTLAQVAEKSVNSLRSYFDEMRADVSLASNIKSLPDLQLDPEKIEIAVKNLLENAVKFNKTGDIKVVVRPKKEKGYAGLSVSDNGPGIPPEEREKIFQKFYQIEESFTGQVEGAGLGLALVRQIVEAHGGRVGLDSGIGSGSTFYFLLPI